jgi:beta-aspartyl-peptidase (threonine type)
MHQPVIVVHGGAGRLESSSDHADHEGAIEQALAAALPLLAISASAAAVEAVVTMESNPALNAGRGAALAADGSVSLDAGFMDGGSRRYGGVCGVRRCEHPVRLAEYLASEGDYGRLVGAPACDALAVELGLPTCEPEDLITESALRRYRQRVAAATAHDTVGAVALDASGRMAAAVSTGGTGLKRTGRIGDSPVVGAGFWADDRHGACVTTGVGELLLRAGTARRCVELAITRPADEAAGRALQELVERDGRGRTCGLILVTPSGAVAVEHTSAHMAAGWATADGRREIRSLWR